MLLFIAFCYFPSSDHDILMHAQPSAIPTPSAILNTPRKSAPWNKSCSRSNHSYPIHVSVFPFLGLTSTQFPFKTSMCLYAYVYLSIMKLRKFFNEDLFNHVWISNHQKRLAE